MKTIKLMLLFAACLCLFAGCGEAGPLNQAETEGTAPAEANPITITTLEQAKEYFPGLMAPNCTDDELVSVEYTPLTGQYIIGYGKKNDLWKSIDEPTIAREGEPVKQLNIKYSLKDGTIMRANVQYVGYTNDPDPDRLDFKINGIDVYFYDDQVFLGGMDCTYRLTVDGVTEKMTLYKYVERYYYSPQSNFYDEHPDWIPTGYEGVITRSQYYFAGDMDHIETDSGYTLKIPETLQDKLIIFRDSSGELEFYFKPRYAQEPVINGEFGYCWPGINHFLPLWSLLVKPENDGLGKLLATDGENYYAYKCHYYYKGQSTYMTDEEFFAPIDPLNITEELLFDMMIFDHSEQIERLSSTSYSKKTIFEDDGVTPLYDWKSNKE